MNKEYIKESIKDLIEELDRIADNLKWLDDEVAPKNRSIDIYPDMITPKILESLKTININTLSDLASHTEEVIYMLPRIGNEGMRKLRMLLEVHGLRFAI